MLLLKSEDVVNITFELKHTWDKGQETGLKGIVECFGTVDEVNKFRNYIEIYRYEIQGRKSSINIKAIVQKIINSAKSAINSVLNIILRILKSEG